MTRSIALLVCVAVATFLGACGGGGDGGDTGPRAAAMVKLSGDAQTVAQHTALPQPLRVELLDSQGLRVAGVEVAFAAAAGSAYVTPATVTTDAQGIAEWTGFVHAAGTQSIVASASGYPSATFSVNVTAAGSPFDGRYLITYVSGVGGARWTTTMSIAGSSVDPEHPMEPFPSANAFDPATGALHYRERIAIGIYYRLDGSLVLGADGRVTGSGEFREEFMGTLGPVIGTWSAERY